MTDKSMTTQESGKKNLKELIDGNRRFVDGKNVFPNLSSTRRLTTCESGQHPKATILTCSDSRVPVEIIFDAGIGDLFVIRVAGNVCQADETGSIEFGVEQLGTSLVMIMGHTRCGAVEAGVSGAHIRGSIQVLVKKIQPVADHINNTMQDASLEERVDAAVRDNVLHQMKTLLNGSPCVARRVKEGRLFLVGAVYDIRSGIVEVLGEHPDKKTILDHVLSTEPGY